jgi:DNA-directed RNA polymerase sigma subunit (sigma70/sigma32)
MLTEIGREPTPEESAEKPAMLLEKVPKVSKIAKEPISLETPTVGADNPHLGDFYRGQERGVAIGRGDSGQLARDDDARSWVSSRDLG